MECRLCAARADFEFEETVLQRHHVKYYLCSHCGLLQTEEPYWLEEAYASAIARTDTGLVQRNLYTARVLTVLLYHLFRGKGKYLDYAGGYGLLTRLMRDYGFDYYWTDPYCQNLFADGYSLSESAPPFSAVTAFEVIEHSREPLAMLREALAMAGTRTIVLSTETFEGVPPEPLQWWYYSFITGQHISFFQAKTLKYCADSLGLNYYGYRNIHMMTDRQLGTGMFRLLTGRATRLITPIIRRLLPSKTFSDHLALSQQ